MTQPAFSLSSALPVLQDLVSQSFPAPALYVLATPIGNAADITLRALHLLALADAVACEDTRNTAQLLARYGLQRPLLAAHQHNEREVAERLIGRLHAGDRIVLVSDAGTPAVSDPGARIVEAVHAAGLRVIPIPGASAVVAALSAGGLVNDRFHFCGFLPARAKQRDAELARLRELDAILVFYEAPHRIVETVAALAAAFEPQRQIVFARELTKLFEEIHRCPLSEAVAWLGADSNHQRGEFVLLVEGAPQQEDSGTAEADRVLSILLEECPVKQAAALAARITGQKKNALYERALALKAQAESDDQR
jgi:16S rRNA (cytidine1402-2'-O)-methyltransferase